MPMWSWIMVIDGDDFKLRWKKNPKCDTLLVEKPQKRHRFWWWLVTMNLWLSGMKPPLSLFLYSQIIICSHLFILLLFACAHVSANSVIWWNSLVSAIVLVHHVRIFAQGQTCAFAPTTIPPLVVANIFGSTFALRIASLSLGIVNEFA